MRFVKNREFITLLLINEIKFNACSNKPTENNRLSSINDVQEKNEIAVTRISESGTSPSQVELDKAKNAGKAFFLAVTGTGITGTNKTVTIVKGANAIYKNIAVVQMNRNDSANAPLVTEWRLAGAPPPNNFVISSKGIPIGGYV